MTAAVDDFETLRPHLLAVAYRLTGLFADAEDIVQDAWLRYDAAERDQIADPRAWLTTVVSRLGLDRLRSASRRREMYVGEWLPEPVVTGIDTADPLSAVVAGEDAPVRRDNPPFCDAPSTVKPGERRTPNVKLASRSAFGKGDCRISGRTSAPA